MKPLAPLTLFAICIALSSPLMAAQETPVLKGCAAKQQDIRDQLATAKAKANTPQVAGLEKALGESTSHCTDAALQKERENKVLAARHEVAQRQTDLDKAMKKADPDKINVRKEKLAESRRELQQATDELDR